MAVGGSAAALGASLAFPVARFVEPVTSADRGPAALGQLDDFPLGTAKRVVVHDRPVLVVREASGEVRAFLAACTHLGCIVDYAAERGRIECPCHGGAFGLDGRSLEGPPLRPLQELAVTVERGALIVRLT
jgi:cytochrome b6-f complex iron-sulfur subunit